MESPELSDQAVSGLFFALKSLLCLDWILIVS
jgi:hypothetical protein